MSISLLADILLVALAMGWVLTTLRRMPESPRGAWYLLAFVPAVVSALGQVVLFVTAVVRVGHVEPGTAWTVVVLGNASFVFGVAIAIAVYRRRTGRVSRA